MSVALLLRPAGGLHLTVPDLVVPLIPPGTAPVLVDPQVVNAPTLSAVELAPLLVALLVGVFIPMLTDLFTHTTAAPGIKSALAAMLAAVAGAATTVIWEPGTGTSVYLLNMAAAFVAAMTAHKAGVAEPVQRAVPGGLFAGPKHRRAEP